MEEGEKIDALYLGKMLFFPFYQNFILQYLTGFLSHILLLDR